MEPTIYKPSIYKGAGIYKNGANGGGGEDPYININGDKVILKNFIFHKKPNQGLEKGIVQISVNFDTSCYYEFELFGVKKPANQAYWDLIKTDQTEWMNCAIGDRSGVYCAMRSYHNTNGQFTEYFSPININDDTLYKVKYKYGGIIWEPGIGNSSGSGIWTNTPFNSRSFTKIKFFTYAAGIFPGKIKSCKIYDSSNNLLLNVIPAFNETTNKPGVIDLMTLQFYPASSTGDINEYIGVE